MTNIWGKLKHFKKEEFDKYTQKNIDPSILLALDSFRTHLGCCVYPSPAIGAGVRIGNEGGTVSRSWHCIVEGRNSKGRAVDVFIGGSLIKAALLAIAMPEFGGVGIYPYWKWENRNLYGGLHLDTRPVKGWRGVSGVKQIWWRDLKGEYLHFSLDSTHSINFKNLFKIISSDTFGSIINGESK